MSFPNRPLRPQARPRSLDVLEAEISRTETARARWATRVRELDAAGLDSGYCQGLLGIAQERLARLNRSRGVLLDGEQGHD